jgi:RecA-family ATPase
MFFEHARATDGTTPDPLLRTLTCNKANYGPAGTAVTLRWERGVYVPQTGPNSLDKLAVEHRADETFLELLSLHNAQGQNVSASPGPTYAPAKFAVHPKANGIGKRQFEAAMQRHLQNEAIRIEVWGSPSRQRSRLTHA